MRMIALSAILASIGVAAVASGATTPPANFFIGFGAALLDENGQPLSGNPAVGEPFFLYVYIGTNDPPGSGGGAEDHMSAARSATYALRVPSGLRIGPAQAIDWPSVHRDERQSTTCVSGCRIDLAPGVRARGAYYRLSAPAAGEFFVSARTTSTSSADPDEGDNFTSWLIRVGAAPESSAKVRAGRLASSPAVPLAGKVFALTLPLTRAGAPVRPASVRCAATLAGRALVGSSSRLLGRARCSWKIPAGSAGSQLKTKVTAIADGRTFAASRTTRVA
jgi:hypothetical protein